jgi:hypothetical protein
LASWTCFIANNIFSTIKKWSSLKNERVSLLKKSFIEFVPGADPLKF